MYIFSETINDKLTNQSDKMVEDGTLSNKSLVLKEIDQKSIKYLAAGEKINNIETAIRELVENSVDAKAKNIEVRLAKFGVDSIEVEDNGIGIDEKNFPLLGLRYHTSKISDFQNFQTSLETYGFRGEALSCLCNIANVTITTRAKTSPNGWRIVFKDGAFFKSEPIGRDTGTTVILKNIFQSMPVRRRELELSAKKQYDKIVRILYEQTLARPHIKFSLYRKVAVKKERDFTHGGSTLAGCLISIFGLKLVDSILPIRQIGQDENVFTVKNEKDKNGDNSHENNLSYPDQTEDIQLVNTGSNTNGKQPECDLISNPTSVSDSNASVYDICTNNDTCYSNGSSNIDLTLPILAQCEFSQSVAPSRDQIFFKRARKSRFARERPEYTLYGYISKIGQGRNSNDQQYIFVNKKPCEIPKVTKLVNEIYRNFNSNNQYPFLCLFIEVQRWATDFNVPRKRGVILQDESKLCDIIKETLENMYSSYVPAAQKSCPMAQIPFTSGLVNRNHQQESTTKSGEKRLQESPSTSSTKPPSPPTAIQRSRSDPAKSDGPKKNFPFESISNNVVDSVPDTFEIATKRARTTASPTSTVNKEQFKNNTHINSATNGFRNGLDLMAEEVAVLAAQINHSSTSDNNTNSSVSRQSYNVSFVGQTIHKSPTKRKEPAPETVCRFSQNNIMQDGKLKVVIDYLEDLPLALEREHNVNNEMADKKEFSFAIHPKFNEPAVEELKFHLNKSSFANMQVIGQFNRGFIIARLNKHLFIIDQHATDERANYEEQLEISPLVKQPMVHPKPLYLNLIQENAILNNMDAFLKRGFEFETDTQKLVGYRVMLKATSICRGPERDEFLGKEDVEELVDVCVESPNNLATYTLSKVKTISASLACRKSVMVGDSLSWSQMERIVSRMSNLSNPWVCAHNRPTIRHLMDTDWMDRP